MLLLVMQFQDFNEMERNISAITERKIYFFTSFHTMRKVTEGNQIIETQWNHYKADTISVWKKCPLY